MAKKDPRTDILLVCDSAPRRFSKIGSKDLIYYLHGASIAMVSDVAEGDDWVEVYMAPGSFSHLLFVAKAPQHDGESFLELVIRTGQKSTEVGYPDVGGVFFFCEIRGAYTDSVGADFRIRLERAMGIRVRSHTRPHKGLEAHLESEIESQSAESKGSQSGPVGVTVEDLWSS